MAEEKNSIFDLANELGYQSPFGDWLKTDFKTKSSGYIPVRISGMVAEPYDPNENRVRPSILFPNPTPTNIISTDDTSVKASVKITVYTSAKAEFVEIALKGGATKRAVANPNIAFQYEAVFVVTVLKALAPIDGANQMDFTFTASATDLALGQITDTKVLSVTVDTAGRVPKSQIIDQNAKNSAIKIVIDPGHGYTSGNTGASSGIYTYKVQGTDGEPLLDTNGEPKTESASVIELPQYVIDDPNAWIISKKSDSDYAERALVFDVSIALKKLLEKDNFTCFITRESKVIQGNDGASTRSKRIALANENNADYFISVHADGAGKDDGTDNYTSSGAHVIYPKTSNKVLLENCKTFGTDIFKFYNVVAVLENSPKEDTRGLQVLSTENKTERRVLVELGFVTNPREAKAMFTSIEKIADQLYQGIVYNVENNFK